jgi:nitrite reductase (NADH) small subunit
MNSSELIYIGSINDIPKQGSRKFDLDGRSIAIFRTAFDKFFALNDSCPHKKGQISEGIVHGSNVTCPLHNWVINLEDGRAHYPDEGRVTCYATMVEGNKLFLKLAHDA